MLFSDFYKVLALAEKVIIYEMKTDKYGDTYDQVLYEGYIEEVPIEYMKRRIVQLNTLNFTNAIAVVLDKE